MNSVRDWSLDIFPLEWMSDPVLQVMKVRSSIFIITSVCAGLPALVWSVSDIIHHRKNGLRISLFIILLLFSDFLELLLSPYILIKDLLNESPRYANWTFWGNLWLSSRVYGFILNQLLVLQGHLSVKYPQITTILCPPYFRIFYIHVFLCFSIVFTLHQINNFSVFFFIITGIACFILCGVICTADWDSHSSKKTDHHIYVVFIFNLLIYLNYFLILILQFSIDLSVQIIPLSLVCLRLISDPLLCVLICKQNLKFQTLKVSQKPEEIQSGSVC